MKQAGRMKRFGILFGLVAAATILMPPASGAGHRLVTRVSQPVEINGQLFPAGELAVRQISTYSPTSTLNEVWVGGECLGLLLAETRPGEQPESGDSLVFEQDDRGHLVLVGFAYRGQNARELPRDRTQPGSGPLPGSTSGAPPMVAVK